MNRLIAARLGLVCSVAALSLVGASAQAEEGVAFKNLMGQMGLISPEKDPIRYHERAPLVLPPKAELPAPSASLAAKDPAWPKDPDVVAKERRAALERTPVTASETRRMSDNNAKLSVDEIRAGRTLKNPNTDPSLHRGENARDVLMMSPDQLRAKKKTDDEDVALAAGEEPSRKALTDPPSGMRKSATGGRVVASHSAPAADQQERDANPINWLTRKLSSDGDE